MEHCCVTLSVVGQGSLFTVVLCRKCLVWNNKARRGMVVCGVAWHGGVWHGDVWRGVAWHCVAWHEWYSDVCGLCDAYLVWYGVAWRGIARNLRHGVAWFVVKWCGVAWRGMVWCGGA